MSRLSRSLLLAAGVIVAGCSADKAMGPQPGTLLVKLQNPNSGGDGAMLLTLSGPTLVTNVATVAGDTLWTTDFSGTVSHIVLTGNITSGVVLTFNVPDVNVSAQYLVTVNQAASSSDYSLRALTSYVAFVSR
ncbi:MAG TPA: hypothetical protein VMC86_12165 [Gemmatimonadales bacterium]|nr:hypothetical protein [Gemmatimonadales bacterium]